VAVPVNPLVSAFLALVALAVAPSGRGRVVAGGGVRVTVPPGWHRVAAAPSAVTDPLTLLVAGTAGVRPRMVTCQVAAYRIPPRGAVVVIVGWRRGEYLDPRAVRRGRAPLKALRAVRRPSFECFGGRGAAAQVTLARRSYQVNVMVGDRASPGQVRSALAVARSFALAR
jgi:hypothetical protein